MNFKHLHNLQESIDGMKKIFAISWSPNLLRLAVAHVDEKRSVRITLYEEDGKKKEMFQTKPANKNSKSYVVKEICFSPDSTKLAVSQSDCIIFVYNLGANWGDKKVICNKFEQNSPVTAMIWPHKKSQEIFFGIADGKIKKGMLRNNSAQILYTTGSFVVNMSYNEDNNYIISCHMDNSIFLYNLEKDVSNKICTTNSISYCLSFLINNQFITSTLDKKINFHSENGNIIQSFDYSKDDKVKDFTISKVNSNFDLIAIGNYNRVYIYSYNTKQAKWEESSILEIDNYYSFTALCWKQDFGVLVTGSLCGSLDMFESCLKKTIIDKFEITYISLSQIMIKDTKKGKRMTIKTTLSPEILKVNVQEDNFIIINTENSLIVGDLTLQKISEVSFNSNGTEKFDFNNYNSCLVYSTGEIAVIEFGNNEIIGYFKTDYSHQNLISAKISSKKNQNIKLIAYLIDPLTIYIQDLNTQNIILNFTNDSNIEYLEFNKSGNKLVFRDSNKNLNMLTIPEGKKVTLVSFCNFVQWVKNSDVLVAQNSKNLYVWYNIDNYTSPELMTVKGNVELVERRKGKIEVFINEGNDNGKDNITSMFLNENLVNLTHALDERDLTKAVSILDNLPISKENILYWKKLSEISLQERNLTIALRCFASLGDYSKISYIKKILKQKEKEPNNPLIEVKLLVLEKNFREAEELMLKNNMIKEAIEIFKELHKYEEALRIAENHHITEYNSMKQEYFNWLIHSEMFDKAAELKIKEGFYTEAIKYYIQGDMQVKAANFIIQHKLVLDSKTIDYLVNAVQQVGLNDTAERLKKYASEMKGNN